MGNGAADAESVDSGDIGGAGAQLGEAEDVEDMVATQDSTEAINGAAMGDISMDYGAVNAEEGAKECQDEFFVHMADFCALHPP